MFLCDFIGLGRAYQPGGDAAEDQAALDRRLLDAASSGDTDSVRRLLDQGANIEVRDANGFTVLHYAAKGGNEAVVELLIAEKSDLLDIKGANETTVLHLAAAAAAEGAEAVVDLLIKSRPDLLDVTDANGATALHCAAAGGTEAVVRLLIEKGANVDARAGNDSTVLHLAATGGKQNCNGILHRK